MKLGMQVGLCPGHIVLDGDPAPLPQKVAEPPISAHVYCQMAGRIKMPLGTEVRLSQAISCYMGTQLSLPKKGAEPPTFNFRPMSMVARGLDG